MSALVAADGHDEPLTWDRLTALEPALLGLERRVRAEAAIAAEQPYCATDAWYRDAFRGFGYRAELNRLVGWTREAWTHGSRAELFTSEAHDLAVHHLERLLPPCSHGGPCWPGINPAPATDDSS